MCSGNAWCIALAILSLTPLCLLVFIKLYFELDWTQLIVGGTLQVPKVSHSYLMGLQHRQTGESRYWSPSRDSALYFLQVHLMICAWIICHLYCCLSSRIPAVCFCYTISFTNNSWICYPMHVLKSETPQHQIDLACSSVFIDRISLSAEVSYDNKPMFSSYITQLLIWVWCCTESGRSSYVASYRWEDSIDPGCLEVGRRSSKPHWKSKMNMLSEMILTTFIC